MSSSNTNNPQHQTAFPDSISQNPGGEPTPSTRQDLPQNNDPLMKKHEDATNPIKGGGTGSGSIGKGQASVGKEGDVGGGEDEGGKKGLGDKVKEKLGK